MPGRSARWGDGPVVAVVGAVVLGIRIEERGLGHVGFDDAVGLGAGAPSTVSAYATSTAAAVGGYPGGAGATGTTLSTGWGAKPTGTSAPISPATGAGVKVGSGIAGVLFAAVAVMAAL